MTLRDRKGSARGINLPVTRPFSGQRKSLDRFLSKL